MADPKSRKFMLVFQSAQILSGWDHQQIKEKLNNLGPDYWAMVDEIGTSTQQLHTHVIFYRTNAVRTSTLRRNFPGIHQEILHGTMDEARTYLLKDGKFSGTEKAETTIEGTFEEGGNLPVEKGPGHRSDYELIHNLVNEGKTDKQIVDAYPQLIGKLTDIGKYRELLAKEKALEYRNMKVIYMYGVTGSGKTRLVYEEHADNKASICTVNSYGLSGTFDMYETGITNVLCLDEFRSSLPFGLLLSLTDGQPQTIVARYYNRVATHTVTYIISNIPLTEQYPNIQAEEPESWKALLRRITLVRHFYDIGKYEDYSVDDYFHAERYGLLKTRLPEWEHVPITGTPFSEPILNQESLPFIEED